MPEEQAGWRYQNKVKCAYFSMPRLFFQPYKMISLFPHSNSDGYHLMLCYDEGALNAKISFVGSQGGILPSLRLQYLYLHCLRALLIII